MNWLKAVVRDVFFFFGVLLWLVSCLTIWVSGRYPYQDASGALTYTLAIYLIFVLSAVSHYLGGGEYCWFGCLKRFLRDLFWVLGVIIVGINGLVGLTWAQFVSGTVPSRNLMELVASVLAHLLIFFVVVTAHYISSKREG